VINILTTAVKGTKQLTKLENTELKFI